MGVSARLGAGVVDFGEGGEVELVHLGGAEGGYLVADVGGFLDETGYVYVEAGFAEGGEVCYAAVDVVDCAAIVL